MVIIAQEIEIRECVASPTHISAAKRIYNEFRHGNSTQIQNAETQTLTLLT